MSNLIDRSTYSVNLHLNTLDKLNPSKLLLSGYSYATINAQSINAKNVNVGDEIDLITHNAKFKVTITEKEKIC